MPVTAASPAAPELILDRRALPGAVARVRETLHVVREHEGGRVGVAFGGVPSGLSWLGTLPPLYPEWLGDRTFTETHGTRFPYIAGAMANGIGSTAIVIAMAKVGGLGFFGAAGLVPARIAAAIDEIQAAVGDRPYGFNLIHNPQEPRIEAETVELYLKRGVRRASAAAFMNLTLPLVRYAVTGLRRDAAGRVTRLNHVFAKISRPELARRFMLPAPEEMLAALVQQGAITADEAAIARTVPIAEDITVESDSGGHTDNRPLGAVFPAVVDARDEIVRERGYTRPIRVGAAGGLGTPSAVAGAFAMGAAYVLIGSVNQGCVESGVSTKAKEMLALAEIADVAMAPAADMFEMGVEVQVLKRGTMFAARAQRLHELYQHYTAWTSIPADERAKVEQQILRGSFDTIWAGTERFWAERDPSQVERARKDARHQMALVFRWYLGKASRWAIEGDPERVLDYQLWCGPAMGAFNRWVKGSPLDPVANRHVDQVCLNLMEGAAVITRAHQLRTFGVAVPDDAFSFRPRLLQ